MTFLKLNGWTVPVLDASVGRKVDRKGDRRRSFRGEVHDGTRGSRRAWNMTACFTDIESGYADARAFQHFVSGEGHYISFGTGLQASTGLNPLPGYTGLSWNGTNGYDGQPGYLDTTSSTLLQYDAQLGDDWSVLFRDGGVPTTWLGGATFNSAGRASYNGTSFDYEINKYSDWDQSNDHIMRVIDGVVTFEGTLNSTLNDIVIFPWVITDAMADFWSSGNSAGGEQLWGPLPSHRMTGTIISEGHTYVVGEVTGYKYVSKPQRLSGSVTSTWVNNAMLVDFVLMEVARTYVRLDVL